MTDIYEAFVAGLEPTLVTTSGCVRVQLRYGQWSGHHNLVTDDGDFYQRNIDYAVSKARSQLVETLQRAAEELGGIASNPARVANGLPQIDDDVPF